MSLTRFLTVTGTLLTWSVAANAVEYESKMLNLGPHGSFEFAPALLQVKPGDTVHFVAKDKGHNVQSIPGMLPAGAQPFSGGLNKDLTVTLTKPGVYGIECAPHFAMGMVALIVVGDASPNLQQAKSASVPPAAKQAFAKLFDEVARQNHRSANARP